MDALTHRIAELQEYVARLRADTTALPSLSQDALPAALEALAGALEELRVSQEEVRAQDEELAASRRAVEAEHQRYLDLFETAPDAYLVTDPDGIIQEANRAAGLLLGGSAGSLPGKPVFSFVEPEDQDAVHQALAALQRSGTSDAIHALVRLADLPLRLRPRHGLSVDAEATAAVTRTQSGVTTFLWLLRDVRARRQAEAERLRLVREEAARAEAEAGRRRVSAILESITDAFFALDGDWRFTYVNPQAERLLRRSRAYLLGRNIWEHFPEALGTAFEREYRRAMDTQAMVSFEEFYPPLGRWFEVRAFPSGEGLSVFFLDTSERRAVEEAKQREADRQRQFIRDVLRSVTEDRLRLCDAPDQLPAPLDQIGDDVSLAEERGLRLLRRRAEEAARLSRLPDIRAFDLMLAVGEAAMNAVVHGRGGHGRVCADSAGTVQVWITDQGAGIRVEDLPRATLEAGWSTAGTAGQGFKMILRTADRIWLLTGPTGTTLVLEQDRIPAEPAWLGEIPAKAGV